MRIGRVLLVLVGLVSALTAYLWVRRDGLRLIAQTTADPTALGQVGSTSMNPVKLRLETRRVSTDRITFDGLDRHAEARRIERSIAFEVPAAFINLIDLKQAPAGPSRVGFMMFSESFAPYRPAELESNRLRIARRSREEQRAPFDRYPGEDRLEFEVSNDWTHPDERQPLLISRAMYGSRGKACQEDLIQDGRYLRLSIPLGVAPRDSCQNYDNENNGFTLLKRSADEYEYVIQCHGDGMAPEPIKHPQYCQISGFFEGWPIFGWVNHRRQADWDLWHSRIQQWLKDHRLPSAEGRDPS